MPKATVRFSGICTHFQPDGSEPHRVRLPLADDPNKYGIHPAMCGVPPHDAYLTVAMNTLVPGSDDPRFNLRLVNNMQITIEPAGEKPDAAVTYKNWHYIPKISALVGRHLPITAGIEQRCAAWIEIPFGELVAVDYDARSGDASALWIFDAPHGKVNVTVRNAQGTITMNLIVSVPPESLPVEPLIDISNLGRDDDSPADFLFHYYMLFERLPPNRTPLLRHIVEGGTTTGCSNSNYP
ncbi:MAG TPA: hypothetical protein VF824_16285 [Thermoanaerobaculia bacterium]|jgi:hypothetical protein